MALNRLDPTQTAAAAQFDRQSEQYGRSHVLADTADVAAALESVPMPPGGRALDVATGGGHTALALARAGWSVTAGDIALRMLQRAEQTFREAGAAIETRLFTAENIPFPEAAFDLVTVRVASHHFSSPHLFAREVARVLRPGGSFVLIDGSVPDDDPETDAWLNRVEKWRDPSHVRLLSRAAWLAVLADAGLEHASTRWHALEQPDLNWYFEVAATPDYNRSRVLESVRTASPRVREAMRLREEDGRIRWTWRMLTLVARKPVR